MNKVQKTTMGGSAGLTAAVTNIASMFRGTELAQIGDALAKVDSCEFILSAVGAAMSIWAIFHDEEKGGS